jgi:2-oxoglutarate ferredoxin oxidoreductase subunit delta
MSAKGRIAISQGYCKSCGLCVEHCPKGGIRLGSSFNDKGYHPAEAVAGAACTGCGVCAVMCPEAIIEVWRA